MPAIEAPRDLSPRPNQGSPQATQSEGARIRGREGKRERGINGAMKSARERVRKIVSKGDRERGNGGARNGGASDGPVKSAGAKEGVCVQT